MESKTPETFEELLTNYGAACIELGTGHIPALEAVLQFRRSELEAAKREARIDERQTVRTYNELTRIGREENDRRIAELSHPNQPKQEGGGES